VPSFWVEATFSFQDCGHEPSHDNPEGVTVTLNQLLARTAGEGWIGRRCDGRVVTPRGKFGFDDVAGLSPIHPMMIACLAIVCGLVLDRAGGWLRTRLLGL
jgi:hypothetical protein